MSRHDVIGNVTAGNEAIHWWNGILDAINDTVTGDHMMSQYDLTENTTVVYATIPWWNGTFDATNDTVTGYQSSPLSQEVSLAQKISTWLLMYFSPFLLFAAVFGNLTSFAVFSMPSYRHSLTAMLYRILAVADTMAVVVQDGLNIFPSMLMDKSLMLYNTATCKLLVTLHFWLRAFSAWVLVIVGLERFIGILFPHRAKVINTKRRFAWITVAVATVLSAFYIPLLVSIERVINDKGSFCAYSADRNRFKAYWVIFDWGTILLTCLLPFAFIIIFNVVIVSILVKGRIAVTSSHDNDSKTNSAVAMLISVSLAFIVLTLPFGIYTILQEYYLRVGDMASYWKTFILYDFASICDSTNHSINVLLYCLTGRKFRQCLRKMVCCVRLRKTSSGRSSQTRKRKQMSSNWTNRIRLVVTGRYNRYCSLWDHHHRCCYYLRWWNAAVCIC